MTQISEATAFETPGHAGSLQWKERATGTWVARGLGGTFHVYPAGGGGYTAYWDADGTGTTTKLGEYGTLGSALAACSRHQHTGSAAAEGAGSKALGSNVARRSVASAYGADNIESVSGSGSSYSVTLKNGKRLKVEVDGSTGTVVDPSDGHTVATHTVSEAPAPCGCNTAPLVARERADVLHETKPAKPVKIKWSGKQHGTGDRTWTGNRSDRRGQYIIQGRPNHEEYTCIYFPNVGAPVVMDGSHKTESGAREACLHHANPSSEANERVPVLHEDGAADAGPYATTPRDTKELEKGQALGKATTPRLIYDMLYEQLSKESQEVFLVVPLTLYGEPLSRPVEIARGQRDRVNVSVEDIFRPVIATNAKGFVMVHNHPSLHARPSPKDRELTENVRKKAKDYSFHFLDHVIIATSGKSGEYYSFTENKICEVK